MLRLKNSEDIKRLADSGYILGSLLRDISVLVQEGISLKELDSWAEDFICKKGAKPAFKGYMGFKGTLCLSVNEVVIHGIPTMRKLKKTDIISIDCGVNLAGYFTDAAVTIALPEASLEALSLIENTQKALYFGIHKAVIGNRIKDIGSAIFEVGKSSSYGIVYQYCGHGVGFDLHEEPNVPNLPEGGLRIKEGLVLAIEPMFNLGTATCETGEDGWSVITKDRKISSHFEHTVAITKDGPLILTMADN